jgi:uncharacterized membrane protein (UPF0136 family)
MLAFAKIYFLVFAALTAAGGIFGYVKSQSVPSLIAGVLSGLLLATAGVLVPQRTMTGAILGLVISLLLLGKFLPAVLKGSGNVAALPISFLSVAGALIAIVTLIRR